VISPLWLGKWLANNHHSGRNLTTRKLAEQRMSASDRVDLPFIGIELELVTRPRTHNPAGSRPQKGDRYPYNTPKHTKAHQSILHTDQNPPCPRYPGSRGSIVRTEHSDLVLEELVRELEVRLPPVHPVPMLAILGCHAWLGANYGVSPCALVVEEAVRPLFKLLRYGFGLLVTLKPSLVLLVEAPALVLQRPRREVLLVRALLVVKDVE
jgi:hypothetical protein